MLVFLTTQQDIKQNMFPKEVEQFLELSVAKKRNTLIVSNYFLSGM